MNGYERKDGRPGGYIESGDHPVKPRSRGDPGPHETVGTVTRLIGSFEVVTSADAAQRLAEGQRVGVVTLADSAWRVALGQRQGDVWWTRSMPRCGLPGASAQIPSRLPAGVRDCRCAENGPRAPPIQLPLVLARLTRMTA